jgi:hypothetical protein
MRPIHTIELSNLRFFEYAKIALPARDPRAVIQLPPGIAVRELHDHLYQTYTEDSNVLPHNTLGQPTTVAFRGKKWHVTLVRERTKPTPLMVRYGVQAGDVTPMVSVLDPVSFNFRSGYLERELGDDYAKFVQLLPQVAALLANAVIYNLFVLHVPGQGVTISLQRKENPGPVVWLPLEHADAHLQRAVIAAAHLLCLFFLRERAQDRHWSLNDTRGLILLTTGRYRIRPTGLGKLISPSNPLPIQNIHLAEWDDPLAGQEPSFPSRLSHLTVLNPFVPPPPAVYESDPSPPEEPTPDVEVSEQPSSVGEGEVVECEEPSDVEPVVRKEEHVVTYHADVDVVPVGFEQLLKALPDLLYPGDVGAFMSQCTAYSGVYSKYSNMPNYATTAGLALKFALGSVERLGSYYHEQATARVLLEVSKLVARNSRTLTLEYVDAGGAPAPSQSLEAQAKTPKTKDARISLRQG